MNLNSSLELRKFVAPEFIFGVDARHLAGRYAENYAIRKALVVTDPGVIKAGWTDDVTASMDAAGIPYAIFSDITSNPRIDEVMEGSKIFVKERCDALVAVGGGSPIDCAKGIGIVSMNGGNILDYVGIDKISIPICPLICVPTTSGSAADVSQFAIISDLERKIKTAIISKAIVPDVSLIDPITPTTLSSELTADTGIDAIAHGMEAYVSNANSPITDLFALEAIRLVVQYLRPSIDDPRNLQFRSKMMLAALEAGLAFSNASLGAIHALSHSVSGLTDRLHGLLNAILLPYVIRFNFPSVPDRYRDIGNAMGIETTGMSDSELQSALFDRTTQFLESLGIETKLSTTGIKKDDIPELAEKAMNDSCMATNPRRPTKRDVEVIFEEALGLSR